MNYLLRQFPPMKIRDRNDVYRIETEFGLDVSRRGMCVAYVLEIPNCDADVDW